MSNARQIILIWGAAILIYLLVTQATGTKTVLSSFSGFVTDTTKTLQGR